MNTFFAKTMSALVAMQGTVMSLAGLTPMKIVQNPSVFDFGGDYYSIIWVTNRPGSGNVTYNYNGTDYSVNDQTIGNINTTDTIHVVRVPKAHLEGNRYTCHSQHILIKLAYTAFKGKTISSETVTFRGYNSQSEINALVLSDIHGNYEPVKKAVSNFEKAPDLVILNGDISGDLVLKEEFVDNVLAPAADISRGEIPVIYNRGNHETRGAFAPELAKYFVTETTGLYYTFTYGPLWAVVLDSGEDKPDNHIEYSGLVDFQTYIDGESKWLAALQPDTDNDIKYRVAFSHMPNVDDRFGNNWTDDIERLGVSVLISGHTHTFELNPDYNKDAAFKTILEGGKTKQDGFVATMLTFRDGNTMHITAYDNNLNTVADEDMILS